MCFPLATLGAGPDVGLKQTESSVKARLVVHLFAHEGNPLAD